MKNQIQQIINWNNIAGNSTSTYNPELEKAMLTEELNETLRAIDNDDIVEVVDGVLDTFIVGIGTLHKLGLKSDIIAKCFEEIMASNFSKFTIDRSGIYQCVKNEAGKIQKPAGFKKPDLRKYLEKM